MTSDVGRAFVDAGRAAVATRTEATARARARVAVVDVVRGAVMVLMALDHVRDFTSRVRTPPENLAKGTAALFATRWVTHFCAPTFALLAGVGIGLAMQRGRAPWAMSRFLVVRGLWLIALDLFVTAPGWRYSFDIVPMFAVVLWALGLSMIVMAALVHLPRSVVLAGALATIALHDLLDGIAPAALGRWAPLWTVLHVPGFAIPGTLFIAYPLVPWVAVMALGWALAEVFTWEAARRRRLLLVAGLAATALFIVLRAHNGYGDPGPWSTQRSPALTVASFLNVRKYPPSLDFLLMTLGPALVALALLERASGRVARWLAVYGSVPLFYYCVHVFLLVPLGALVSLLEGGGLRRIGAFAAPDTIPAWYGLPLPGVYAAWALVVLLMFPLCRWFGRVKRERRDWWLSYL